MGRAFALSFGLIFVAELGDKSQLMALAFAARRRALPVLVGITLATAVVHAASVVAGAALDDRLPTDVVNVASGVAFLGFAAWTLRGDRLSPAERARASTSDRHTVAAVAGAFLLAELGDKTMLATITLAARGDLFAVWLGSTLGMVAADALAVALGRQLGTRLPERAVRVGAASAFALFGALLLAEGLRG